MVPQQHFDKPGKSPFMDMQLVPKYADEAGGEGTGIIDPRVAQNLGVRTAAATAGSGGGRLGGGGRGGVDGRGGVGVAARPGGLFEKVPGAGAARPGRRG